MPFTPNSLDILAGAKAYVQFGDWVTAGGAASLDDCGYMSDMEVDVTTERKNVEADNALSPISAYLTKRAVVLKGTIMELDLVKFGAYLGDAATQVVTVARAAGVTDGTMTHNLDEPGTPRWLQVVLVAPQNRKPGATDYYTTRTYTLWRCLASIKGGTPYGKDKVSTYKLEIEAYLDDSVAAVGGIYRRLGTIVDLAPK